MYRGNMKFTFFGLLKRIINYSRVIIEQSKMIPSNIWCCETKKRISLIPLIFLVTMGGMIFNFMILYHSRAIPEGPMVIFHEQYNDTMSSLLLEDADINRLRIHYEREVLVSIVICVNSDYASSLHSTVESILKQSFPSLEAILVKYGKMDEIQVKWNNDNRIRMIERIAMTKEEAIRIGLENARGNLVMWIESGTILQYTFLENFLKIKAEFLEVSFFQSWYQIGKKIENDLLDSARKGLFDYSWTRSFLIETRCLDFLFNIFPDIELNHRSFVHLVLRKFRTVVIPKVLLYQPVLGNEETETPFILSHPLDVWDYYPTLRLMYPKKHALSIAWTHLGLVIANSKYDTNGVAWQYFQNALNVDPFYSVADWNLGVYFAKHDFKNRLKEHLFVSHLSQEQREALETSNYLQYESVNMEDELFLLEEQISNLYQYRSTFSRPYKLIVVPSDALHEYVAKGNENLIQRYYNPLGFFDTIYAISNLEKKKYEKWGMIVEPSSSKNFAKRVSELGVQVIRAYGGYGACTFATRADSVPVICSAHDTNSRTIQAGTRVANYLWAVSNAVADALHDYGVSSDRIMMFSNRVDTRVFRPINITLPEYQNKRQEFLKNYPGKYRILHIGRKEKQKNYETLLGALQVLGPDYVSIMIGRGESKLVMSKAKELGVDSQIYLDDSVPNSEIPWYLANTDVHCTPSLWEGFGIVFIEALASEAVVVTSNIAPMNEYITHLSNGILVDDYQNPEALAEFLKQAIHDQELRRILKSNARRSALKFDKFLIDKWEIELYRYVLSQPTKIPRTQHTNTNQNAADSIQKNG